MDWKGRNKTDIIHRQHNSEWRNPGVPTDKSLELINKLGKVIEHKINI